MAVPAASLERHLPCTQCGYDLHGLDVHAACPECNKPIQHSIEADELHLKRLNRPLFGILLPIGYALAAVVAWFMLELVHGGDPLSQLPYILIFGFISGCLGAVIWILEALQKYKSPTLRYGRAILKPSSVFGIIHLLVSTYLVLEVTAEMYAPIPDPSTDVLFILMLGIVAPASLALDALMTPAAMAIVPANTLVWIVVLRWIGERRVTSRTHV